MKRNKLNLLSLLVLTSALVACGSTGNNPAGNGGGDNPLSGIDAVNYKDKGELQFDSDGNVVLNNVEITMHSICNGTDAIGLEKIVNDFNKEYEGKIKVNFTREGQGSYYTNLSRKISTNNNVPELTMFHNQNLLSMQMSKLFQPMDRVFEMSKVAFDINDYNENTASNCSINGKLYGVPIDAHSEIILYRKDLLKKYNLEVPTCYDDLLDAAKTIQEGEKKKNSKFNGVAMSTEAFGTTQYLFNSAIVQNGGSIVDSNFYPNWKDGGVNHEALKSSCQLIKNLFYGNDKVAVPGQIESYPEAEFTQGQSAFSFIYTWTMKDTINSFFAVNASADKDSVGVLDLSKMFAIDPETEDANKMMAISHAFCMPKTVEDVNKKAACAVFSKWFTENQTVWSDYGHVPQNKKALEREDYKTAESTINYVNNFGKPTDFVNFPQTPYYSATSDNLQKVIVMTLASDDSNIEELINTYCDAATKKINSIREN